MSAFSCLKCELLLCLISVVAYIVKARENTNTTSQRCYGWRECPECTECSGCTLIQSRECRCRASNTERRRRRVMQGGAGVGEGHAQNPCDTRTFRRRTQRPRQTAARRADYRHQCVAVCPNSIGSLTAPRTCIRPRHRIP